MFVVAVVLAASVGVTSSTRRARVGWITAAVVLLVIASLTKQTGATGFLLVGIVVWNGLARPPRWMVVAAVASEGVAVFVASVVTNGATQVSLWDLPRTFVDRTRLEVFTGSWVIVIAAAISLFLVAWAVPRATQPLTLAGLTITAAGLALGVYASGLGLQQRNAAMIPYGVALLVGALVAAHGPAGGGRRRRGSCSARFSP
ncbi:MAG: hypothetical protein WAV00_15620 [Nocardioides sp.]